jgi:hypothetical protein
MPSLQDVFLKWDSSSMSPIYLKLEGLLMCYSLFVKESDLDFIFIYTYLFEKVLDLDFISINNMCLVYL